MPTNLRNWINVPSTQADFDAKKPTAANITTYNPSIYYECHVSGIEGYPTSTYQPSTVFPHIIDDAPFPVMNDPPANGYTWT